MQVIALIKGFIMQSMNDYKLSQEERTSLLFGISKDKLSLYCQDLEATGMNKEQRGGLACQRRLRQMEAKRAKQEAKAAREAAKNVGV